MSKEKIKLLTDLAEQARDFLADFINDLDDGKEDNLMDNIEMTEQNIRKIESLIS